MIVSVDGALPKDERFILVDDKLYQYPGFFNSNDALQIYQADLAHVCDIKVLVEEQEEKIDTPEKTARNIELIIGLIGFFAFFFVRDLFQSLFIVLLCLVALCVSSRRSRNYQKGQKAVLELYFTDQTKTSLKVDRDERESLYLILEKNKHNPNQIVGSSIYLGSLTAKQKDTARARYWQIPVATVCFYTLSMKAMLSFLEYSHKTSGISESPLFPMVEKMSTIVFPVLSYSHLVAFGLIVCIWIRGQRRRAKLNGYDLV